MVQSEFQIYCYFHAMPNEVKNDISLFINFLTLQKKFQKHIVCVTFNYDSNISTSTCRSKLVGRGQLHFQLRDWFHELQSQLRELRSFLFELHYEFSWFLWKSYRLYWTIRSLIIFCEITNNNVAFRVSKSLLDFVVRILQTWYLPNGSPKFNFVTWV